MRWKEKKINIKLINLFTTVCNALSYVANNVIWLHLRTQDKIIINFLTLHIVNDSSQK